MVFGLGCEPEDYGDRGTTHAARQRFPPRLSEGWNSCGAGVKNRLGPAMLKIAQCTPPTIAGQASPLPSRAAAQHSLAGGRYPLPAPVFHRHGHASLAWRTLERFQGLAAPIPESLQLPTAALTRGPRAGVHFCPRLNVYSTLGAFFCNPVTPKLGESDLQQRW
jgi:hypothetical protein